MVRALGDTLAARGGPAEREVLGLYRVIEAKRAVGGVRVLLAVAF
jgi:hypothetical protein